MQLSIFQEIVGFIFVHGLSGGMLKRGKENFHQTKNKIYAFGWQPALIAKYTFKY